MGLLSTIRKHLSPPRDIRTLSGPEFERWMANLYTGLGYPTTVLGGSGDQGVDLIVVSTDGKIAIQCKQWARPVGNSCVQEVLAGSIHHRCDEAWVVAPNGFTPGARELARSVGVKLYDAGSIREWVEIANRRIV